MGFKARVGAPSPVIFSHLHVMILRVNSDGQAGEQPATSRLSSESDIVFFKLR